VAVALVFITIMSLVKEPNRQKINAIIIAGAGSVYWSDGLGVWEFVYGSLMLFVAFKGLKHSYFIGIGWLLHTIWDNCTIYTEIQSCMLNLLLPQVVPFATQFLPPGFSLEHQPFLSF